MEPGAKADIDVLYFMADKMRMCSNPGHAASCSGLHTKLTGGSDLIPDTSHQRNLQLPGPQ